MEQVRKIDMAIQQLEDALTTYYLGRYHSALVLAGAAEELFGVYVRKHGGTPAWGQTRAAITKISNGLRERQGDEEPASEDEIGRQMNYAYNNSKHAGPADLEIRVRPKDGSAGQDRPDHLQLRCAAVAPRLPTA